jgi:alanyl-tRNA synthetase
MRRAMRHAQLLGSREPLMWRLLPALIGQMGRAYPELVRAEALISETLKLEETRFRRTLERGLSLLSEATTDMRKGDILDGETAFKLYDTYGFPLDLTQDALRTRGINVDLSGFEDARARQRAEARKTWAGSGEAGEDKIWFAIADKVGPTEFLGYETETAEGVVTALVKGGQMVDELKTGEEGFVVLNQTPFYGESGGQVGDTGSMSFEQNTADVLDTVKHQGVFGHRVKVTAGALRIGTPLSLVVDHQRRTAIRANHSATHLLHEALRLVLGDHVAQRGSLVTPDRLRFDFVHTKPITIQELEQVEDIANDIVLQNSRVETRSMSVDDAKQSGARALFGEKYGDEVRVVSMGDPTGNALGWSVELCGGTHVRRTGDIGLITVLGDTGVSAGVRRIEALTARGARLHARTNANLVQSAADELHATPAEILPRIGALQDNLKKAERSLSEAQKKLALGGGGGAAANSDEKVNGVTYVGRAVEGLSPKDVKGLVDTEKKRVGSGVVVVVLKGEDGRGTVAVGVTDDLTGKYQAGELVKHATMALGGQGGGGRPDMAQGGGPDGSKATEAIAAVRSAL